MSLVLRVASKPFQSVFKEQGFDPVGEYQQQKQKDKLRTRRIVGAVVLTTFLFFWFVTLLIFWTPRYPPMLTAMARAAMGMALSVAILAGVGAVAILMIALWSWAIRRD